jgi:hypothetical protein
MHIFKTITPRPAAIRGVKGAAVAADGRKTADGQTALAGPVNRRQLEKSVSWTRGERFRFIWYRLRLIVAEINYASSRMIDPRIRLK